MGKAKPDASQSLTQSFSLTSRGFPFGRLVFRVFTLMRAMRAPVSSRELQVFSPVARRRPARCGGDRLAAATFREQTRLLAAHTQRKGRMSGDLDFENLVRQHYGALYRFAVTLTRNDGDAGDLVQETFLVWAAKGHQLRDPSKAKTWLFTTLHRQFLETQRRRTRFPHHELDEISAELPGVEPAVVDQLDARRVVELLGEVDPQFQAAVALFYLEDCPYAEIAEVLGVPLGTVKSRIARGLGQLKRLVLRDAKPETGEGRLP
jgi:RNA polymerase sigma factor (sigma-70 family)